MRGGRSGHIRTPVSCLMLDAIISYYIYWSCLELLPHSIAQKLLSTPTLGAGNQDPVVLSWWRSRKRWRSRKDISASLDILDFSLNLTWMRQYLKDVCATFMMVISRMLEFPSILIPESNFLVLIMNIPTGCAMAQTIKVRWIRRSMFKYLDMDWQLHVWKVRSPHSEQTKNEHGNWDTI